MERFFDQATRDIYDGRRTQATRRLLPMQFHAIAQRKLSMIVSAASLLDLRFPPSNNLEKLRGDRKGQHSVRINLQYRICFVWTEQGAMRIEITDYH